MVGIKHKVSEISIDNLLWYCRLDDDAETRGFLELAKQAVISYIKRRCNVNMDYIDEHSEFAIVVYKMVSDYYDNRSATVEKAMQPDRTTETILHLHDHNFLGELLVDGECDENTSR